MTVEMCWSQRIAFQGSIGNIALGFYQTVPEADKSGLGTDQTLRLDGRKEG